MIRQRFRVEHYWEVVVFYDLDYNLFSVVAKELRKIGFSRVNLETLYDEMRHGDALAVTCSSIRKHKSIVIFNKHASKANYISSLVHEAEHVKQAMLAAYYVEDKGEPPAYTIGYLVMRMWEVFRELL